MRRFFALALWSVDPFSAATVVFCLKGARMPSIAEELDTDVSTVRSRTAGSRR